MTTRAAGRSGFVAASLITPAGLPGVLVVSDPEGRVDAVVPGAANVGLAGTAWSLDDGSIGVASEAFYSVDGLAAVMSIGSDRPARRIEATLFSPDYALLAPFIALRYLDKDNFLFVEPGVGRVRLKQRVAGVDSVIDNGAVVTTVASGLAFNLIVDLTTTAFAVVWAGTAQTGAFALTEDDATTYAGLTKIGVGFRNDTVGPTPSSAARISGLRVYA